MTTVDEISDAVGRSSLLRAYCKRQLRPSKKKECKRGIELLNRESVRQSSGYHRGEWKLEAWAGDCDLPSEYTLSDLKNGSTSILAANKYSFEKSTVATDESTRSPLKSKGQQSKLPDKSASESVKVEAKESGSILESQVDKAAKQGDSDAAGCDYEDTTDADGSLLELSELDTPPSSDLAERGEDACSEEDQLASMANPAVAEALSKGSQTATSVKREQHFVHIAERRRCFGRRKKVSSIGMLRGLCVEPDLGPEELFKRPINQLLHISSPATGDARDRAQRVVTSGSLNGRRRSRRMKGDARVEGMKYLTVFEEQNELSLSGTRLS